MTILIAITNSKLVVSSCCPSFAFSFLLLFFVAMFMTGIDRREKKKRKDHNQALKLWLSKGCSQHPIGLYTLLVFVSDSDSHVLM